MTVNGIQSEPGLFLSELSERSGTERQSQQALKQARWSQGSVHPPYCKGTFSGFVNTCMHPLYLCTDRLFGTSLIVGTVMQADELPLFAWFADQPIEAGDLGTGAHAPSGGAVLQHSADAGKPMAVMSENGHSPRGIGVRECRAKTCEILHVADTAHLGQDSHAGACIRLSYYQQI